jgi:hypothetical protein
MDPISLTLRVGRLPAAAAPTGGALSRQQVDTRGRVASTFAAGGIVGQVYVLTNRITTSAGRIDSRTITLNCRVR